MNFSRKCIMTLVVMLCSLMLAAGYKGNAEAATTSKNLLTSTKSITGGKLTYDGYGWTYVKANGKLVKNKWKKINNRIYRFSKYGYLCTGTQCYNGKYYFLRRKGAKMGSLVTGWKTISGKRYYFSKTTGERLTKWQSIGGYTYYFNEYGVLQKGKTVDGYWLDTATGRATKKAATTNSSVTNTTTSTQILTSSALSTSKRTVNIFIGDSRTVGMCYYMTGVYMDNQKYSRTANGEKELYFASVGQGYAWYKSTALAKLKTMLKNNPTAAVTLNLGVNDLGNINSYISAYKSLISAYPKAKFVIMSVNPVDTKKYKGYATPAKITEFNTKLRAAFPNNYVDSYNYLKKVGYSTADGLHYDKATYQKIYNYVLTYM